MATRNVTLSLPEELLRRAGSVAAQRGISVSTLVTELLEQRLSVKVDDYDELWAAEEALISAGIGVRVGDAARQRDELHER